MVEIPRTSVRKRAARAIARPALYASEWLACRGNAAARRYESAVGLYD